jgi:hypothetical protein
MCVYKLVLDANGEAELDTLLELKRFNDLMDWNNVKDGKNKKWRGSWFILLCYLSRAWDAANDKLHNSLRISRQNTSASLFV